MEKYYNLLIVAAGASFSLIGMAVNSCYAQAATISYDFYLTLGYNINNFNGKGFFSFESPAAGFNGDVPAKNLDISSERIPFIYPFLNPKVRFENGNFQGLFASSQGRDVVQEINIYEQYIRTNYRESNQLVEIKGSSYNFASNGRMCDSIYSIGTESIDPAKGDCVIQLRTFRFNYEGSVIYSQRSVPESSTVWGLTVLGLAFLLNRKIIFSQGE